MATVKRLTAAGIALGLAGRHPCAVRCGPRRPGPAGRL